MRHYVISAFAALAFSTGTTALPAMAETLEAAQETIVAERHEAWTTILSTYVHRSPDGMNRFDYAGLRANEADRAALNTYINSFAELDLAALSRDEQYAAWINIYNAVTIKHIVDRYPVNSIRAGYIVGPWKRVKTMVGGREISLNDIEHEVLRKDWNEPRTHYAVNCASYGCPNLKPTAWEAATLEEDLTEAAIAYINHPRGVSIRNDGRLEVSTIYKWFREDFGGTEAGVIDHIMDYAEPELAAQIEANPDIKSYDYDWSLNDIE